MLTKRAKRQGAVPRGCLTRQASEESHDRTFNQTVGWSSVRWIFTDPLGLLRRISLSPWVGPRGTNGWLMLVTSVSHTLAVT